MKLKDRDDVIQRWCIWMLIAMMAVALMLCCAAVTGRSAGAHEVPGENIPHLHGDELTNEHYIAGVYAHPGSVADDAGSDGLDIGTTRASVPDDTVVFIVGNMSLTIEEWEVLVSFAKAYAPYNPTKESW